MVQDSGVKANGKVLSKPKGGTAITKPTPALSPLTQSPQSKMYQSQMTKSLAAPKPVANPNDWRSQPNSQTGPGPGPAPTPGRTFDMGGPTAAQMSAIQAPTIDPKTDYLKEAGYMANISALDKALQEFNSQDTAERGRYDVDYKEGLRGLGYRDENIDDTIDGEWDFNDQLTASGRGYQQNLNDFASRGMLESQGYYDSVTNLKRSLADQLGAMTTGRQNFKKERDEGVANYGNQDQAARATAMTAAIERLSAQLGLI
jgi:hypothetical protein